MAKKENTSNTLDGIFSFGSLESLPKVQPQTVEVVSEKSVKPEEPAEKVKIAPTGANKRGRKPNTAPAEQSEGKKTVTVYLNAENWAQFCLVAQVRKPSASAWLDELIAEEVRKNKEIINTLQQLK